MNEQSPPPPAYNWQRVRKCGDLKSGFPFFQKITTIWLHTNDRWQKARQSVKSENNVNIVNEVSRLFQFAIKEKPTLSASIYCKYSLWKGTNLCIRGLSFMKQKSNGWRPQATTIIWLMHCFKKLINPENVFAWMPLVNWLVKIFSSSIVYVCFSGSLCLCNVTITTITPT